MKKFSFVVMALALAMGLGTFACTSGDDSCSDTDTDTDIDTDTDTDAGTDTDTDTDTDTGCGFGDEECCSVEPGCDTTCMAVGCDIFDSGCCCYVICEPALCTDDDDVWLAEEVVCGDVSKGAGTGACFSDEDAAAIDYECVDPCTTASGYEDGICLSDGTNQFCMRECVSDNTGCDVSHYCAPITDSGTGAYTGSACMPTTGK